MDSSYSYRRSPVYGRNGCVASSQPLASQVGIDILKRGGNAADAAVAVAAALNVLEPCSTGIGGDAFAIYYDSATKRVHGVNGSGKSPAKLTKSLLDDSPSSWHPQSALAVTVPGAAAAWMTVVEKFGSGQLSRSQLLEPAIQMAEEGVPISPVSAYYWDEGSCLLTKQRHGNDMLVDGRAPRAGEIFRNPFLGRTFRALAEGGAKGFYEGRIASAIVDVLAECGGVMSMDDLSAHTTELCETISVSYKGICVHEIPPPGQGLTALMALNNLEAIALHEEPWDSSARVHAIIESLRMAFADTRYYVCDPESYDIPLATLLSKTYARQQVDTHFRDDRPAAISTRTNADLPVYSGDTVYFSVVDGDGNACSFINSNYMGFGTGIVPEGCGFTLQNRGYNFRTGPGSEHHPNVVAPRKRPYHTIIPGLTTTASGDLHSVFGVMGGFMQPQGHVQVLSNMIDYGMNPQEALDAPRVSLVSGACESDVAIEDGYSQVVEDDLRDRYQYANIRRHKGWERSIFGRGQIILRDPDTGVLCAGSDGRADGCAIAF